mgnify:CR=1 FL=1
MLMASFTNDEITNEPVEYINVLNNVNSTVHDSRDSPVDRDLLVMSLTEYAKTKYTEIKPGESRDSGYDLYYCGEDVLIQPFLTHRLNMGIACKRKVSEGYDLRARSSIDKTPLILCNGIGTIDCDYRGEILASVRNLSREPYLVVQGTRLFQLTFPRLQPFSVGIVDELDSTERGTGGFGSTGTI